MFRWVSIEQRLLLPYLTFISVICAVLVYNMKLQEEEFLAITKMAVELKSELVKREEMVTNTIKEKALKPILSNITNRRGVLIDRITKNLRKEILARYRDKMLKMLRHELKSKMINDLRVIHQKDITEQLEDILAF